MYQTINVMTTDTITNGGLFISRFIKNTSQITCINSVHSTYSIPLISIKITSQNQEIAF
jgi:hypothetical protein